MQENKPVLIVGLGNPGAEYEKTRHNVGFMAVKYLAGNETGWKHEHDALTMRCVLENQNVILVMPQTFMNDSGRAVGALMSFYKLPLENLIVIHDDMDLPNGVVRTKIGGGSAGHNGIKSIDSVVGNEYKRIRIGIDHPRNLHLQTNPADWVLGRFSDEQLKQIMDTVEKLVIF